MNIMKFVASFLLPVFILSGCTAYKTQYAGFRPPSGYPNYRVVDGVLIGGEAYAESDDAEKAFGFDIKGAGLLPVQVVMENKSGRTLELVSSQIFLMDKDNRYWKIIPTGEAISRLETSTELAAFMGAGAAKGAILGAVAGTVLGAAVGIVAGRSVGEAIGKGAVIGAAGGAIIGGAKEGTSGEREYRITEDIRSKSLEGKVIPDQYLADGFLFFPAEAESARELRLQYQEKESGVLRTVTLPF